MENLLLLFATSLAWRISAPKFKRYIIGKTGCTSLLHSAETTLHIQNTQHGERVYFYEHNVNGVVYGLITVTMTECFTLHEAETVLGHYLNRIRKPFGIEFNVKMERDRDDDTITLTDYWQDEEGTDWKVKGHTNGAVIAVLYVKNIGQASAKEHDAYLNGFRFEVAV